MRTTRASSITGACFRTWKVFMASEPFLRGSSRAGGKGGHRSSAYEASHSRLRALLDAPYGRDKNQSSPGHCPKNSSDYNESDRKRLMSEIANVLLVDEQDRPLQLMEKMAA